MKLVISFFLFFSAFGAPTENALEILSGDLPSEGTVDNPLVLISGTQKLPNDSVRMQKYDEAIDAALIAGKTRFIIGAAAGVDSYAIDKLGHLKACKFPNIDLTIFEAQKKDGISGELEPFSAAQKLNHAKPGINRFIVMEGGFRDRAIHMMKLANEVIGFADGLYDFGSVVIWSMILDFGRSHPNSALSTYDAFHVHCKTLQGIRENYKENAAEYVSKTLSTAFGGKEGALKCLEYLDSKSIGDFKDMVKYVKDKLKQS